jgi:hypothetical protein
MKSIRHFLILFALFLYACGDADSNDEFVPADLMGSWQGDNSAGCSETFAFTSNHLNWKQYCPLVNGRDDVDYPISGSEPDEDALKTDNGYWFLHHLNSATSLTLRRWDGDTDLTTIEDNWYESRGITLTKD